MGDVNYIFDLFRWKFLYIYFEGWWMVFVGVFGWMVGVLMVCWIFCFFFVICC